jgi:uncharacterized delta-60 repeat protein
VAYGGLGGAEVLGISFALVSMAVLARGGGVRRAGSSRALVGIFLGVALACALCAGLPAVAAAAPGDFDRSFGGGDGIAPTAGLVSPTEPLLLAGGRVLVSGSSPAADAFVLRSYLPGGGLDPGFGQGGAVVVQTGTAARATTLDSQGRIVTVGLTDAGLVLSRVLSGGQPDPSLDGDGLKTVPLVGTGVVSIGADLVALEGGAVALPAAKCEDSTCGLAVIKLTSAGELDGGFGAAGIAFADFEDELGDRLGQAGATTLAARPDGRLLAGGYVCVNDYNPTACRPALAAFTVGGGPDTSFNTSGHRSFYGRYFTARVEDLALDTAGNAVVVGGDRQTNASNESPLGRRLSPQGALDAGFELGAGGPIVDIAFDGAGRMLVSTRKCSNGLWFDDCRIPYLDRHNPDGSLDTAFATGGRLALDTSKIVVQSDGKIVAAIPGSLVRLCGEPDDPDCTAAPPPQSGSPASNPPNRSTAPTPVNRSGAPRQAFLSVSPRRMRAGRRRCLSIKAASGLRGATVRLSAPRTRAATVRRGGKRTRIGRTGHARLCVRLRRTGIWKLTISKRGHDTLQTAIRVLAH